MRKIKGSRINDIVPWHDSSLVVGAVTLVSGKVKERGREKGKGGRETVSGRVLLPAAF